MPANLSCSFGNCAGERARTRRSSRLLALLGREPADVEQRALRPCGSGDATRRIRPYVAAVGLEHQRVVQHLHARLRTATSAAPARRVACDTRITPIEPAQQQACRAATIDLRAQCRSRSSRARWLTMRSVRAGDGGTSSPSTFERNSQVCSMSICRSSHRARTMLSSRAPAPTPRTVDDRDARAAPRAAGRLPRADATACASATNAPMWIVDARRDRCASPVSRIVRPGPSTQGESRRCRTRIGARHARHSGRPRRVARLRRAVARPSHSSKRLAAPPRSPARRTRAGAPGDTPRRERRPQHAERRAAVGRDLRDEGERIQRFGAQQRTRRTRQPTIGSGASQRIELVRPRG